MLTSLTYVETEQYLVVLFLVTAPRLIVRAGRGHRYAHAFIWKNKELSVSACFCVKFHSLESHVSLFSFCCLLAHGTFLNNIRLEAMKPTPVEMDSSFSFGASSRSYSLRERPQVANEASMEDEQTTEGTLLGLPDDEDKLDVRFGQH